nr:DUF736 family protein [Stutzerimonas stutzeri]
MSIKAICPDDPEPWRRVDSSRGGHSTWQGTATSRRLIKCTRANVVLRRVIDSSWCSPVPDPAQASSARSEFVPNEKSTANAPHFRILTSGGAEIGAAWKKLSQNDRPYCRSRSTIRLSPPPYTRDSWRNPKTLTY